MHNTVRKQADIEIIKHSDISKPFRVDVTIVQQESYLKSLPRVKLAESDNIDCCKDLQGKFVSRNHIFREGASRKLKVYTEARKKEISQVGESTPSMYLFAMDTNGGFCYTAILFLKKIAFVKFSNEPGIKSLLAWKKAAGVQETFLLIQATLLRAASRSFHDNYIETT